MIIVVFFYSFLAYLLDKAHSCVRSIENIASCSGGSPGLDANSFFTGFRVVTVSLLRQVLRLSRNVCAMSLPSRTAEINLSGHLDSVTMSALAMTGADK